MDLLLFYFHIKEVCTMNGVCSHVLFRSARVTKMPHHPQFPIGVYSEWQYNWNFVWSVCLLPVCVRMSISGDGKWMVSMSYNHLKID